MAAWILQRLLFLLLAKTLLRLQGPLHTVQKLLIGSNDALGQRLQIWRWHHLHPACLRRHRVCHVNVLDRPEEQLNMRAEILAYLLQAVFWDE